MPNLCLAVAAILVDVALMSIDDQTWLAEAKKTCLIGLYFKGLTRNCLTN
jgi:hypothetical protein